MKAYWYSILQYVPDPMRREAVNIGVVTFDPDTGSWERRVAADAMRSVERLAPGPAHERAAAVIAAAWSRFADVTNRRGGREEFGDMSGRLAHEAQFSSLSPLSTAIGDLLAATEWVAARVLPAPPARAARVQTLTRRFGELLEAAQLDDFVKAKSFRVRLYGDESVEERFEGAFVNGHLHLARVLPADFASKHPRQHAAYCRDLVEAISEGQAEGIETTATVHVLTGAAAGSEAQRLLDAALAEHSERAKTYALEGWSSFIELAKAAQASHSV